MHGHLAVVVVDLPEAADLALVDRAEVMFAVGIEGNARLYCEFICLPLTCRVRDLGYAGYMGYAQLGMRGRWGWRTMTWRCLVRLLDVFVLGHHHIKLEN